ncbi:MAG: DUF4231 domain-containing protein [Chloroflexi bacterium]|nr:DUF4231 domain-containing protein [Chloroflexota bacterium]
MLKEKTPPTTQQPLVRLTGGEPERPNPTLEAAWQVFADFDLNAINTQERFRRLRRWILTLGVVATVLAILYENYVAANTAIVPILNVPVAGLFRILVVLMPITVSMLLTWASKFERGLNYVLLRGAAESLKREIYEFRAQTGEYNYAANVAEPRELKLYQRVQTISERLMKTEVNKDGLVTYKGPLPPPNAVAREMDTTDPKKPKVKWQDDGFSVLTPEDYIRYRLADQLKFYQSKVVRHGQIVRRLNWRIILFGAIGTTLAFLELEIWIAATTAIVGAITTYLEYNQYENTLIGYNQAARDLESLRMWWLAVPAIEKEDYSTFERLVDNTEKVLANEHGSWIQNMKDALEALVEEDQTLAEEMEALAEKFSNDPEAEYFIGEDPDVIPPEILAEEGLAPPGNGNGGGAPTLMETARSGAAEAITVLVEEHKDEAFDALFDAIQDKTEDMLGPQAGDLLAGMEDKADELMDDAAETFTDKATEKVEDWIDSAAAMLAPVPEAASDDLPPADLTPDMLEDLFGGLDEGDEDDDLADLFGRKQ